MALTRPDLRNMYFKYFGSAAGCPFNDLPFLESLDSACISSIRIKSGAVIDGIQVCLSIVARAENGTNFTLSDNLRWDLEGWKY